MCRHHEYKISLKAYTKEKIRMLKKDFFIKLTEEEIKHLESLTREIDVDHYAHDIIMNKLR